MRTVEYAGEVATLLRSHPWTTSESDPAARYLDLRAHPELIRTALEDFVAWSEYPAIERFYELLEWINGPSSPYESNDCAFTPPHADERIECTGRVIVLFRDLARNVDGIPALSRQLHRALAAIDPRFADGVIGTSILPVRLRALDALGSQLMLSFWAWGESEVEAMANLHRVIGNLDRALRR